VKHNPHCIDTKITVKLPLTLPADTMMYRYPTSGTVTLLPTPEYNSTLSTPASGPPNVTDPYTATLGTTPPKPNSTGRPWYPTISNST
jgi:hypothetical protein